MKTCSKMIIFWNPTPPARSAAIWCGHVFGQNLSAPAFCACHGISQCCELLPAVKSCAAAVCGSAMFGSSWLNPNMQPFVHALAAGVQSWLAMASNVGKEWTCDLWSQGLTEVEARQEVGVQIWQKWKEKDKLVRKMLLTRGVS